MIRKREHLTPNYNKNPVVLLNFLLRLVSNNFKTIVKT